MNSTKIKTYSSYRRYCKVILCVVACPSLRWHFYLKQTLFTVGKKKKIFNLISHRKRPCNLQLTCLLSIEKKIQTLNLNSKVGMRSSELGHQYQVGTTLDHENCHFWFHISFFFFYLFLFSEPSDEDINLLNL